MQDTSDSVASKSGATQGSCSCLGTKGQDDGDTNPWHDFGAAPRAGDDDDVDDDASRAVPFLLNVSVTASYNCTSNVLSR